MAIKKTLPLYFQEFIYECEFIRKIRPETIRGYKSTFDLLLRVIPDCKLDNLSTTTIVQFFKILQERKRIVGKGMIKTGVKKSTIATYRAKLNPFFNWLKDRKLIPDNPLRQIKFSSPVYDEKKYLSKEEIQKILSAMYQHYNKPLILKRNLLIFYLLLFCGLRKGELLGLQIPDINIYKKKITIRASTSKSGRERELPLHSKVIMYFNDYLHSRRMYKTPYVLVSSEVDTKLTEHGLKHIIDKLCEWSGVKFHLHQLRHTFAVNFLKINNNLAKLKYLLGHRSIAMTILYLRCIPVDEMKGDIENLQVDNFL